LLTYSIIINRYESAQLQYVTITFTTLQLSCKLTLGISLKKLGARYWTV